MSHTNSSAGVPLRYVQATRLARDWRQLESGAREPHNVFVSFDIEGKVDVAALRSACRDLVDRHDCLRLSVELFAQFEWVATIASDDTDEHFSYHPHDPGDSDQSSLDKRIESEAGTLFDLGSNRKIHFSLWDRDGSGESSIFCVRVDHLVCDAGSLTVLLADLSRAYAAQVDGTEPQWPAAAPTIRQLADEERLELTGEAFAERLAYWRSVLDPLQAIPEMAMPGWKNPRPGRSSPALASLDLKDVNKGILARAALGARVSPHSILRAAVALTIQVLTGRSVPAMVVAVDIRPSYGDGAVAWFATSLVHRVILRHDEAAIRVARSTLLGLTEAVVHAIPMGKVVELFQPERHHTDQWRPWFWLSVEDTVATVPLSLADARVSTRPDNSSATARDGYSMWLTVAEAGISCVLQYEVGAWTQARAEHFLSVFHSCLRLLLDEPQTAVGEVVRRLAKRNDQDAG